MVKPDFNYCWDWELFDLVEEFCDLLFGLIAEDVVGERGEVAKGPVCVAFELDNSKFPETFVKAVAITVADDVSAVVVGEVVEFANSAVEFKDANWCVHWDEIG